MRHLSDNLLGYEIKNAGGSTFGSAFGLYSYGPIFISITFILFFSFLNFFLLYFITNKIQFNLEKDTNDYSIRNYIYILTSLPFKSTWGGGLFPTQIVWLVMAYLILKIFANFLNRGKLLNNI